jgi:hypothetical protein
VSVLVLESDPGQAERIQHVVRDVVGAKLTLVQSIDQAVAALHSETPDLVLTPALISPEEEAQLRDSLRTLPQGTQVETMITPFLPPAKARASETRWGWRPWGANRTACDSIDATQALAERLVWVLDQAHERRQLLEPQCDDELHGVVFEPAAPASTAAAERRAHKRFQAEELQAVRTVRIKAGPYVSLLDVSVGGALVRTTTSLTPKSEAVLEVVTADQRTHVPFRVVRCQLVGGSRYPRYIAGCAFTNPFDIDRLVRQSQSASMQIVVSNERPPVDELFEPLRQTQAKLLEQLRQIQDELGSSKSEPTAQMVPSEDPAERRQHLRVKGPFDGCRRGVIDLPVRILDISEGGAFVGALVDANPGEQLTLGVRWPDQDWITLAAEVVHNQTGIGFAVRFVGNPEETRNNLARLLASRQL